jgi:hypothetical protein
MIHFSLGLLVVFTISVLKGESSQMKEKRRKEENEKKRKENRFGRYNTPNLNDLN